LFWLAGRINDECIDVSYALSMIIMTPKISAADHNDMLGREFLLKLTLALLRKPL